MNKHIELVKKWLDDPQSVSVDELKVNAADAGYAYDDAYDAVAYADDACVAVALAAANSIINAATVCYAAAYAADIGSGYAAYDVRHYVNKYEQLTKGQ